MQKLVQDVSPDGKYLLYVEFPSQAGQQIFVSHERAGTGWYDLFVHPASVLDQIDAEYAPGANVNRVGRPVATSVIQMAPLT